MREQLLSIWNHVRWASVEPVSRAVAQLLPESVVFWATARALERVTADPKVRLADAMTVLAEGLPPDRKLLVLPVLKERPSNAAVDAIRRALPTLHIYPKAEGED
jgi:hypothetical protein